MDWIWEVSPLVVEARRAVPVEIKQYYWATLAVWRSPLFWGLLALVFVWERWRPADPTQRWLSRGLGQDLLWFHLDIGLNVALLPAVAGSLQLLYDQVSGGYQFRFAAHWPVALQAAVGLLVADLIYYSKHRLAHRVEKLWHFHAVHHSQRQLNLMTDRRQHLFEQLLTQALAVLPLNVLGLNPFGVMWVGAVQWCHTLLVHANIRSNFGPLGWLLVSPQYHRVHHSIEPRHFDRNFGQIFTLWDRVFGTMYHGHDEYPATGVEDVVFPPPRTLWPTAWLADLGR